MFLFKKKLDIFICENGISQTYTGLIFLYIKVHLKAFKKFYLEIYEYISDQKGDTKLLSKLFK